MKTLLLLILTLALTGCQMPTGQVIYPVTKEQYFGAYKAGAVERCMADVRAELKRRAIPLLPMVLREATIRCDTEANNQLRDRHVPYFEPDALEMPPVPRIGSQDL